MKTLLKSILIGLLIGNTAWAGLPPPSIQGQSGSKLNAKFDIQAPNNQVTDLGGTKALIETGNANILKDPGFESGTTNNVTISGGATATVNTTAKGTGSYGMDWDSNAAGQTATGTAITIPEGLKGKNAVLSCNIKTVSGTATHTLAAFDGTTAINPTTIASVAGQWIRTSVNFIMPSSGTITWQMKSVASNEPEIYADDCIVEDAAFFNLSQGSSGQWVGSMTVSGCASPWSTTSTTFVDTTQTGCVYTAKGALSAPTSNWPGFQIASAGAGYYFVDYRGMVGPGNAGNTTSYYEFYDGTNEFSQQEINGGSVNNFQAGISGHLSYTTAQSNLNVRVRMKNDSGQSANIYGTSLNGVFNVYYFPSQSQTGYKPDQTPASYSGYQTGNWTQTTGTSLTYSDFTTGNSPALSPIGTPRNITCVTSGTAAIPGITCNLPKAGNYLVSVNGSIADGTGANNMLLRLTDGSNNPFGYTGYIAEIATANKTGFNFQGQYTATSAGSVTFKLQAASDASSQALTLGTGTSLPSLVWNVQQQDNLGGVYLQNQVSSNTSGQERLERLAVTSVCSADPCTIGSQSGSWVTAVNRSAAGRYTVHFAANEFSGAPSCFIQNVSGGSGRLFGYTGTSPTTSQVAVNFDNNSGTGTDADFHLICQGPR